MAVAHRHPSLAVDGVELAPHKVTQSEAAARGRGLKNVRFAVGDLTAIGRANEYDLVYSVDVLEHVADDAAAMRSIAAALRPGGVALIHVPRAHPRRFFPALEDHHQDDHVRDGYEPEELRARLAAAGLADVAIDHTFGPAGEMAWEIAQLVRRGGPSRARELAGVILAPFLALLCELDFRLGGGSRGNGLLARARRPAVTS
jgi:SAM-dependent methyltransferase